MDVTDYWYNNSRMMEQSYCVLRTSSNTSFLVMTAPPGMHVFFPCFLFFLLYRLPVASSTAVNSNCYSLQPRVVIISGMGLD